MRPIQQGIIKAEMQALLTHLFHKRCYQVTSGRSALYGAQVSHFGIPQSHTVMVLGRDNRVLRSTLLYQIHPCLRVVLGSSESARLIHILIVWQVIIKERPAFGNSFDGIDSPMNENTQLCL